jgi:hypothetical protein
VGRKEGRAGEEEEDRWMDFEVRAHSAPPRLLTATVLHCTCTWTCGDSRETLALEWNQTATLSN